MTKWIGEFWSVNGNRTSWHLRLVVVTRNFTSYSWVDGQDYELARKELNESTMLEF